MLDLIWVALLLHVSYEFFIYYLRGRWTFIFHFHIRKYVTFSQLLFNAFSCYIWICYQDRSMVLKYVNALWKNNLHFLLNDSIAVQKFIRWTSVTTNWKFMYIYLSWHPDSWCTLPTCMGHDTVLYGCMCEECDNYSF